MTYFILYKHDSINTLFSRANSRNVLKFCGGSNDEISEQFFIYRTCIAQLEFPKQNQTNEALVFFGGVERNNI